MNWTQDFPTVAGWYWVARLAEHRADAQPDQVYHGSKGGALRMRSAPISDYVGYWFAGPILPPSTEKHS